MKRIRFTQEQIIALLKESRVPVAAAGIDDGDVPLWRAWEAHQLCAGHFEGAQATVCLTQM